MGLTTSQPPSPTPSPWSTILLWLLAAAGVSSAAAAAIVNIINKNPWQGVMVAALCLLAAALIAFLGKVWQHLMDQWSKDTAKWVDNLVQQKWFNYHSYYARFLTFQHRDFDIKGLSTQSIYTLELEQVFVDLRIDPKALHAVSTDLLTMQSPPDLPTGQHSLWHYLEAKTLRNQQIVVVGVPGSGKTTLLKHLALTLVNPQKRRSLSRPIRRAYSLPFLLLLREHAHAIQFKPNFSLVEAIETVLQRWDRPVPEGWVRRQLSKGRCLILLDGLDEVADVDVREKVVDWVQAQMGKYAGNRFLITSRPFGYRDNSLGALVLEVQPFTFGQIERFVHNWYRANEIMSSQKDDPGVRMRAKEGAGDLIRRIQQTSALTSLAVNPLLLTMISTIHRYRSSLPGKRVELYAEICEVFLGKRQQARDLAINLRPAQSISVLQVLAYEMMVREQREISPQEAQGIIAESLKLVAEQMTPADFLPMVENMSGLLLEQKSGSYSFAHLTFQEYLAARHIAEQGLETLLLAHVAKSWWAETTRLYCAQTDATRIIEACLVHCTQIDASQPIEVCLLQASFSVPHLELALECQEEALKVQPGIKQQLDNLIKLGVEDENVAIKRIVAEALLKRRLKEMIPIKDDVQRDSSLILCAEYQLFLDAQFQQGRYYQPDHWQSTHFPPGTALQPVLGVRPSAAQVFCNWLTEWEQGPWLYRLSRPGECQPESVSARPTWLSLPAWTTPHGYYGMELKTCPNCFFKVELRDNACSRCHYRFPSASDWEWVPGKSPFTWIHLPTSQPALPLILDLESVNDEENTVDLTKSAEWWQSFRSYIGKSYHLASDLAMDLPAFNTSLPGQSNMPSKSRPSTVDIVITNSFTLALVTSQDHVFARKLAYERTLALTSLSSRALGRVDTYYRTLSNTNQLRDQVLTGARHLIQDLAIILDVLITTNNTYYGSTYGPTCKLANRLAEVSTVLLNDARNEKSPSIERFGLVRLFALLSICLSFNAYELAELQHTARPRPPWSKFVLRKDKKQPDMLEIQRTLNRGIEINRRLERLGERVQGHEPAYEGILLVRERKGAEGTADKVWTPRKLPYISSQP